MQLTRLSIERVRNLKTVVIQDLQPFNVFYGENGSGKTSLLEAIHLLATGRSFRTHLPKLYIQNQASNALVFAQTAQQDKIGIQKQQTGEQLIRVNGDSVATQAQLARMIPVQVIEPQSTDIIDHGSKPRRQMLDWLMFHVEQSFYLTWQQYGRALQQRNSLLKTQRNLTLQQLEPWNKLLVNYGEALHQQRSVMIDEWQLILQQYLQLLLPDVSIQMTYHAGFHHELGLEHDLIYYHQKDCERRNTEYGPHRADLKFRTPLGDADEVLSRGQKKMLMIALKLSQIAMLHSRNRETVVLLDDLTAELDAQAQQRLLEQLATLGSQVFITALEHQAIERYLQQLQVNYQLFHVQQGDIGLVEPSVSI
ncbi:MAG: DNA replication/repair protein RecF [Acinetobacter sp.]|nr:DNA replication/repair protein RecF [Acinetobacter sp.]